MAKVRKKNNSELPPLEKFQPAEGHWFWAHVCSSELEAIRVLAAGKSVLAQGPDGTLAVHQVNSTFTCFLDINAPGKVVKVKMQHDMRGVVNAFFYIWWPWLGL